MQDNLILGIILIVIAILEISLAAYLFLTNYKDQIRRWYSFFVLSISIWVGSLGLSFVFTSKDLIVMTGYLPYVGGMLGVVTLLGFSWVFPLVTKRFTKWQWIALIIPMILFTILIYSPLAPVVQETQMTEWRTNPKGPSYDLYNAFILVYIIWAVVNLAIKIRTADGIHRWQLKNLLIGVSISAFVVIVANVLLPWLRTSNWEFFESFIGPALSAVWLVFSGYIIFKKRI